MWHLCIPIELYFIDRNLRGADESKMHWFLKKYKKKEFAKCKTFTNFICIYLFNININQRKQKFDAVEMIYTL